VLGLIEVLIEKYCRCEEFIVTVDPDTYREALARFPAGVTIVTTRGRDGRPYGFTASSFCSVSMSPPMVLVCLARSANSYPVFASSERFAVNMLRTHHTDLAMRFAGKRRDKFADGSFARGWNGSIVLEEALATLECSVHSRHDAGDHMILVGEVEHVLLPGEAEAGGSPAVYVDRHFAGVCTGQGACLQR
jgi:flavin reductase ActVB